MCSMSTIIDVAKLANVSAMTVSRALNQPEKVSPKSLKRIEDAIAQLGYRQNQAARSLVTKTTGVVKIVVANKLGENDPYFTSLFTGVGSELSRSRFAILIEEELSSNMKCDGLIIMGLDSNTEIDLLNYPAPVVLFGKGQPLGAASEQLNWVDVNNEEGSYLATKHLLELGHTDIALFKFEIDEPFMEEREAGYRRAMKEFNIEVKPEWVASGIEHTPLGAKTQTIRTLRTSSVTAIVCTSDLLGLGVTQAAKELGLSIPEQLSVVGFDGTGYDMMADPRLTTVRQPVFEIGKRLGQILLERINNQSNESPPCHEVISTELIVRDSTARKV